MASFLFDSFSGTGAIRGHYPEIPAELWEIGAGSSDAIYLTGTSARDWDAFGGRNIAFHPAAPSTADYAITIIATYDATATNGYIGVVGRFTDALNFYEAVFNFSDSTWYVDRMAGGAYDILATWADPSFVQGQSRTAVFSMAGSQLKLNVNGVDRITVTDTTLTLTGRAGLLFVNTSTTAYGISIDSIQGDDIVAQDTTHFAPSSTLASGSWVATGAGSLHAAIDETSPSDTDYDSSAIGPGANDTMEVAGFGIADLSAGVCTVSYRIRADAGCGARIVLRQGSTPIATWDHTGVGAPSTNWQTFDRVLSGGEVAAISDPTTLAVQVIANPT